MGMYVCQVYMGSPRTYLRQAIELEDIEQVQALVQRFPTHIFSHFPVIVYLNGSVKSLAWRGDAEVDDKMRVVIRELEYELGIIAQTGGTTSGVVIHPGAYPNRSEGLQAIADTINRVRFPEGSRLLLENCAGEGRKLCKDLPELKDLLGRLSENTRDHVGVCLDTAHLWGQGDYDLRHKEEIDRLFEEVDETIGLGKLWLIHLNDSAVDVGSKKDRHARIGTGYIWGADRRSFLYLLDEAEKRKIPMVMETTPDDIYTVAALVPKK